MDSKAAATIGRDYPTGQYNARGESSHANQQKGVGYDELSFVSGYLVFWLLVSIIQCWRIDERSALGEQRVFGRGLTLQQSTAVGMGRPGMCRALACYKVRVGSSRLVRQLGRGAAETAVSARRVVGLSPGRSIGRDHAGECERRSDFKLEGKQSAIHHRVLADQLKSDG